MALKTLRIFISSPGDVAEERLIARRVIGRLDSQFGDIVGIEAVYWENRPLVATASFQEQLPNPSETDIVLTILWSRLGTILPNHIKRADGSHYASGTEFEFDDAVAGFRRSGEPEILVYRKTATLEFSGDAAVAAEQLKQKQSLDEFTSKWFAKATDGSLKAAFHAFASPADFEELVEAHLGRLVEQRLPPGVRLRATATSWRQGSPFRGLEPFGVEHTSVFFGRTAAVANVLLKLRRQMERGRAFVLVVSMSGGGKSSLVRAGVLPLLQQPGVVGTATLWLHAIVRPSEGQGNLLLALTRALTQPGALPSLASGNAQSLALRVTAAMQDVASARQARASDCQLALIVDQLEEMFSDPRVTAAERERFCAALSALARSGCVTVLATLRSDVYPRLAELPELMALKEGDGQFDLLPPTPLEIAQIIRSPAAAAGLRFEMRAHTSERLDDVIRDAAAKNPGALPLLEFLLEELYKRRNSEDVLTFGAYEDLGGVEGALARRAEQAVDSVSLPARQALPAVFRELVALGADDASKTLRRTAPRSAFATLAAQEVVDALLAARLLVSGVDSHAEPVISLAHEALLEFWPRLAEWRDRNRENLHVHARLTAAASLWEKQQRSADFLLARGKPLVEARTLIADGVRLSPLESDLVRGSELRSRRFTRLRSGAIAGLAILAVVASFTAYFANQQSNIARTQATTAQRTTDFMVSLFNIADPEENRGEKVTVREILDRGVTEMRSSLKGEPAVRGNLLRAMGQAYNGLGLYPKAQGLLREAAAAAEKSGVPADILKADLALAANRYVDSDYAESEKLYRKALANAEALYGKQNSLVTQAMVGLADSVFALDRSAEAEGLYREALSIDLRLHGEKHIDTARSLGGLGRLLFTDTRYAEAEPVWRRVLDIRESLLGERHPLVAESISNLGSLLFQMGQYRRAQQMWSKALPVYRQIYGDVHLEVARALNNLGRVELLQGDLVAARRDLEEALAIQRKLLSPDHDDLIAPMNSMGMVLLESGDIAAAKRLFAEAINIARLHKHWMLNQILANQGDLYVRTGLMRDAKIALDDSKRSLEATYGKKLAGSEAWRLAVLNSIVASFYTEAGDYQHSAQLLQDALPVLESRFGKNSLYAGQAAARLRRLHIKWGKLP